MAKKKAGLGSFVTSKPKPNKPSKPLPPVGGGLPSMTPGEIENLPMAPTVPQEFDMFEQLMNAYTAQINAAAAAQREAEQREFAAQSSAINKNYDKSANGAYIQYKQNAADLPEKLSNLGATGGASESAQVKLQSAYGTNLSNNENARGSNLADAQSGYAKRLSGIDSNAASSLASAQMSVGQQKMSYELEKQREDAAKAEAKAEKDKAKSEQAKVDSFNRKQMVNIAKAKQKYNDVTVWTDKGTGKIRYYATNKKKLNSSGGSSRSASQTRSSGSTSYGGGATQSSATKSTTKKKSSANGFNLARAAGYVNQNAAKLISNPSAVIADVRSKVKAGKLSNDDANYILGKISRKK